MLFANVSCGHIHDFTRSHITYIDFDSVHAEGVAVVEWMTDPTSTTGRLEDLIEVQMRIQWIKLILVTACFITFAAERS